MTSVEEQREYHRKWYRKNSEKRKAAAREHMRRYREKNPELTRAAVKKWREDNKEKIKNSHLVRNYGITLDQMNAMFLAQGSACAICRSKTTKGLNWHVDHCHQTGRVRGVLCNHCNLMIGHAKDRIETLLAAVEYLK